MVYTYINHCLESAWNFYICIFCLQLFITVTYLLASWFSFNQSQFLYKHFSVLHKHSLNSFVLCLGFVAY